MRQHGTTERNCFVPQSSSSHRSNKSDSAKDAQIARFKERVRQLEAQVKSLKEENELLYGKLTDL